MSSQQAATPVSSAAASTSSAAAAAASSSAAPAVSSSSAAASSAAGAASSSSSSAAASSSSASAAASSSASAAASTSTASASASSSSSASASASSSSSSAATAADVISATSAASTSGSKKGLSGGAIGGIVAGAVVAILVAALLWLLWRRKRKTRGEKIAPPPPMSYAPAPSMAARHRQSSVMGMNGMAHTRSMSTYSGLMAPPRPSSTFNSHSRSPSSHINYPIVTPGSTSHDASPPMPPSTASNTSESPPLSTGTNTPAHPMSMPMPPLHGSGGKPTLAPIDTSLQRDNSASSEEFRAAHAQRPGPRHVNSIDRLRNEANAANGNGSDRAPSPASSRHPSESGNDYSRANSPHTSMNGFPSPSGRGSVTMPRSPNGYPRPMSMASLGSQRYLHVGPAGRAPHQGRPIQLTMPTLLGARPDENGDFFGQSARFNDGYHLGLDEMGRMRRISNRQYNEQDYAPSPAHTRAPSSNSLSNRSRQGSDEGADQFQSGSNMQRQQQYPREVAADPRTVLNRQ